MSTATVYMALPNAPPHLRLSKKSCTVIAQSASLQDGVCVPKVAAKAARADYLALSQRLELYQFFNGVDSVFLTDNNRTVISNNRFVMS